MTQSFKSKRTPKKSVGRPKGPKKDQFVISIGVEHRAKINNIIDKLYLGKNSRSKIIEDALNDYYEGFPKT